MWQRAMWLCLSAVVVQCISIVSSEHAAVLGRRGSNAGAAEAAVLVTQLSKSDQHKLLAALLVPAALQAVLAAIVFFRCIILMPATLNTNCSVFNKLTIQATPEQHTPLVPGGAGVSGGTSRSNSSEQGTGSDYLDANNFFNSSSSDSKRDDDSGLGGRSHRAQSYVAAAACNIDSRARFAIRKKPSSWHLTVLLRTLIIWTLYALAVFGLVETRSVHVISGALCFSLYMLHVLWSFVISHSQLHYLLQQSRAAPFKISCNPLNRVCFLTRQARTSPAGAVEQVEAMRREIPDMRWGIECYHLDTQNHDVVTHRAFVRMPISRCSDHTGDPAELGAVTTFTRLTVTLQCTHQNAESELVWRQMGEALVPANKDRDERYHVLHTENVQGRHRHDFLIASDHNRLVSILLTERAFFLSSLIMCDWWYLMWLEAATCGLACTIKKTCSDGYEFDEYEYDEEEDEELEEEEEE